MTNLIEAFDPRTSEQLLAANQNTIPNIDSRVDKLRYELV